MPIDAKRGEKWALPPRPELRGRASSWIDTEEPSVSEGEWEVMIRRTVWVE
jgi:hypothetical protein